MEENRPPERNPFIEPEDYWAPMNESIKSLRNNPEVVEFDKLCYEVFDKSEMGKKFMELVIEKFFIHSQIARGQNYQIDAIWQEGFRDAWRMIMYSVRSHAQRIKSGAITNV